MMRHFTVRESPGTGNIVYRYRAMLLSIVIVFSGFVGISFNGGMTVVAGSNDYTSPGGVQWYMEDLAANSSGNVTGSGDDFYIHGNITIPHNASLIINESYTCWFDDNVSLLVRGKIVSNGTSANPVVLCSNDTRAPGAFKGIRFDSNGRTSYLNHTTVFFADTALYLMNSTAVLYNVSLNETSGPAMELHNSTVIYHHGTINYSLQEAVKVNEDSAFTASNLTVWECSHGINARNGINISVSNSVIRNVTEDGICAVNLSNVQLSNITLENCSGNGLNLVDVESHSWNDITISACTVGVNVTNLSTVSIHGANGAWCSGDSNVYYRIRNVNELEVCNISVVNNGGSIFLIQNVSTSYLTNITASAPGNLPVEVNNTLASRSRIYLNGSSITNTAGGIRVEGAGLGQTEMRVTNTTFANYGTEYVNATNSTVILLNSTYLKDHVGLNYSQLRYEHFMCVRPYNATGNELDGVDVRVRSENGTYDRLFPGCVCSINGIRWENITYEVINVTNTTNITYYYPLNVSVERFGYSADNLTIPVPGNYPLVFYMDDIFPPDTWWTVLGVNYTDSKNMLFINDTTLMNLTAFDFEGCGVNHTYYNLSWVGNHTGFVDFNSPFAPYDANGSGSYVLRYYSVDYENNTGTEWFQNITVDVQSPEFQGVTLIGDYREHQNDTANVSSSTDFVMNFTDDCGVQYHWHAINGQYSPESIDTFRLMNEYPDGTYNISMGAADNLGQNGTGGHVIVNLDNTRPVVTESVDKYYIDPETEYFYVGNDTSFNLTATDEYSGVRQIFYELDSDPFNYTGNISTASLNEGAHSFRIKGEDNLGNWGYSTLVVLTSKVFIVDVTAPTVTVTFNGDHHVLSGTEDVYLRGNTVFTLTAEDESGSLLQSGVSKIWYSLDGEFVWGTFGGFDELSEGEHTLIYGAVDNIGNNDTEEELTIFINESAPTPPILRPATNRTRYENLLIEGWAPPDSTVRIVVNYDRTYEDTPAPEDGGNFSFYVILDPGVNILTGYTVDYFGRLSVSSSPETVILDNEPPMATGIDPERNGTEVPVDSDITIYFNEPLSELVIMLKYYNETTGTWELGAGDYDYVPWSLRVTYKSKNPLHYETRYRVNVEMLDMARNFAAHDFYSRNDHSSSSFITESTEHVYQETNCVIKSQKIDITYNKLGERLARSSIWKPLAFEPQPPPEDHVSFLIYFNVTFDSSVAWFRLSLWDYNVSTLNDATLRNPARWDFENLSFYRLTSTWEKLNTITVSNTEIQYFMNNPGSETMTMGVFAPDLDWDGDGYLNTVDEFPRDRSEYIDSDGDGTGDANDPFPHDPLFKADNDDDDMPSSCERLYGLAPFDSTDKEGDLDGDGLENWEEFEKGTLPNHWDSDGDGIPDGWEVEKGLDPTNALDALEDWENDTISNLDEYLGGTDPSTPDTVDSKAEKTSYTPIVLIVIFIVVMVILLGYLYVYKKNKKTREETEDEYFDLEDLASVDFPEDLDWDRGMEPLEVFELDYLDDDRVLSDIGDMSRFDEELYSGLIDKEDVFTVPFITCSDCGEAVEDDDTACPECEAEFDEEPVLEPGVDEEELEELSALLKTAICSNCDTEISPTDKRCGECGSVFLEEGEMVCDNCDGVVDEDADKCDHCGAVFE